MSVDSRTASFGAPFQPVSYHQQNELMLVRIAFSSNQALPLFMLFVFVVSFAYFFTLIRIFFLFQLGMDFITHCQFWYPFCSIFSPLSTKKLYISLIFSLYVYMIVVLLSLVEMTIEIHLCWKNRTETRCMTVYLVSDLFSSAKKKQI